MRVLLLALAVLVATIECKRIVGFTYPGGHSHHMLMAKIGRELVSRGHEFQLVQSDVDSGLQNNRTGLNVLEYKSPMTFLELQERVVLISELPPLDGFVYIIEIQNAYCQAIMADKALLDKVRGADAIFIDMLFGCSYMVADLLNIPVRVDFSAVGAMDPYVTTVYGVESPLAYVPQSGSLLTNQMEFGDRVKNTITYYVNMAIFTFVFNKNAQAQRDSFGITVPQDESRTKVGISVLQTSWVIDYPRPIVPAMKMVGPILPEPGKALPEHIEAFLQSAGDEGVLFVSLGTFKKFDRKVVDRLASALAKLPYKVVWKNNMNVTVDLPNVLMLEWAPQNDILAHKQTRAFLTHGGLNGCFEAAYHGVPIVGLPLFGDQFDNVDKLAVRGMGLVVNRDTFTDESLAAAIKEVFTNPSYREKAQKAAAAIRDVRRTPTQEAADWVEYAMAHDGALFNVVPAVHMSWVQRNNYDVAAVLLTVLVAMVYGVFALLRKVVRKFVSRVPTDEADDKKTKKKLQ